MILIAINHFINYFESRKYLISSLFKNYTVNSMMMKKIKIILSNFNEVDYEKIDINFNNKTQTISNVSKSNFLFLIILFIKLKAEKYETTSPRLKFTEMDNLDTGNRLNKYMINDNIRNYEGDNNDPLEEKAIKRAIDISRYYTNEEEVIKDIGYTTNSCGDLLKKIFCPCAVDKKKMIKRKKYFDYANNLFDYYCDISVYFKKMMEIDIIKYYLFSKSERNLVSVIANPNFYLRNSSLFDDKLYHEYSASKYTVEFDRRIESVLNEVVHEGRNKKKVNKLIELIQIGNQDIFDY